MEREGRRGKRVNLGKKENWLNGSALQELERRLDVDPDDPTFKEEYKHFVEKMVKRSTVEDTLFLALFQNKWLRVKK